MKKLALSLMITCISFVSFAQITGPDSVCVGAEITLTVTPLSARGSWSSANNTIATVTTAGSTTGIVTGVAPGVDTILYPGGTTGIPYFTHIVTVNPLPAAIVGPDTVCIGATITLTDATTGGTWSANTTSAAILSSTIGAVTGVSATAATITFEAATGCYSTHSVTVMACTTGITEMSVNNDDAKIYPNPTYEELTVKTYPGAYNSFVITNEIGQVMQRSPLRLPQTTLNIRTLPPGLYYILLTGENESKTLKFVKM